MEILTAHGEEDTLEKLGRNRRVDAVLLLQEQGAAAIVEAIEEETGQKPELSTSGGTSDGRFLIQLCPVVDFGLPNATMHKLNECAAVEDIQALSRIYERIMRKVLG